MDHNGMILDAAARYLGLQEWPGAAKSNPEVERLFTLAGHPDMTDDVPWCAAFVGAVLAEVGLIPSGSLMARSYATWGREVSLREARPGDVVVFPRGAPPSGHVGFLIGFDGDRVIIRGGNQGNAVSDQRYAASTILAIRRADPSMPSGRATLRPGDRGAMVLDLQDQLFELGYFTGRKDAIYGPLTRAAVLAFQADHGLDADAVVGNRTWEALARAEPKPLRKVNADDLRDRGSKTIKSADGIDLAAGAAAITATATAVRDAAEQATGVLPVLNRVVTDYWPLLLVAGFAIAVVVLSGRIKRARVEDARTGANLSK